MTPEGEHQVITTKHQVITTKHQVMHNQASGDHNQASGDAQNIPIKRLITHTSTRTQQCTMEVHSTKGQALLVYREPTVFMTVHVYVYAG